MLRVRLKRMLAAILLLLTASCAPFFPSPGTPAAALPTAASIAPPSISTASAVPTLSLPPSTTPAPKSPTSSPPPSAAPAGKPESQSNAGASRGYAEEGWPMAGANPARTSWTSDEVPGRLKPVWFVRLDAYISQKVQIIASGQSLYISASDGLHALDAASGAELWFYPTSLPLGHSPTVYQGIVYVGGFDNLLHAVDAKT
ncbi:MAG TPA: PQQ-binding-like beta-propeller repeat protein, partial [Anaerolineales bacterium]